MSGSIEKLNSGILPISPVIKLRAPPPPPPPIGKSFHIFLLAIYQETLTLTPTVVVLLHLTFYEIFVCLYLN